MANEPPIPRYLNWHEWDKQKGLIAKFLKRKTGITEALKALEATYDHWEWHLVNRGNVMALSDMAQTAQQHNYGVKQLQDGLKACQGRDGYLNTVKAKLDAVKNLANQNAAEFKKSTVIPKSAREFLEHMSGECNSFIPFLRAQIEESQKKIVEGLKAAGEKV